MANGNGKKKINKRMILGASILGIGAYLLWRAVKPSGSSVQVLPAGAGGPVPSTPAVFPTDSMMPGALPAAVTGLVKDATTGQIVQAGQPTCPAGYRLGADNMCYPIAPPQPINAQTPTNVPSGTVVSPAMPSAFHPATTPEGYLAAIGNPSPRVDVHALPPRPGLFPPFKGQVGPKQKKCLNRDGTWTGPTGKKFCVLP